jgi:dihydrofolate reductase
MRKLIYYVASTLDSFIAREDGSFDCFPMEGEHITDFVESFPETIPAHLREVMGIHAENKYFDAVLMGRKTYEVGLNIGVTNPYPQMKQYLFSRTMQKSPDENVELISEDAVTFVRELKKQPGKDIWLCGGGALATTLFPEIDSLIIKLFPILLGSGIPLFSGTIKLTDLELTKSKIYSSSVILLHYQVKH